VWAPQAGCVRVVLESGAHMRAELDLQPESNGTFVLELATMHPGDLYRYRMDDNDPWPDPASRFQPQGAHGPSQLVNTSAFKWSDSMWKGTAPEDLVLYELHLGTFTREGTFAAAADKLPYLRDLGITAVELMPIADFPGSCNWGYDGVCLFAPANSYGTPKNLAAFVDTAHKLDLGVHLDVVYNHLGPDGAYMAAFSPFIFSRRHKSPWGAGLNFDGPHNEMLRRFFIENALYWIHEFHIDGLRLDATHAIVDDSPTHFLAELRQAIDDSLPADARKVLVVAEDDRNLARIATPRGVGGYGLDGLWADDLHHQVHCCLTGQRDGYFADFSGSAVDIATTVEKGWFYCGQHATYFGGRRGSDPISLPPSAFVVCLQNHDQVGNRAMGERLHHLVDLAAWRAATVLLLLAPETPLLFMGQEWAASTPFQYFTNHNAELGRLVTEGRRREFARFASFSHPASRECIPDPQDPTTFSRSKLAWEELDSEPHASTLLLTRTLLQLRALHPALRDSSRSGFTVAPLGGSGLILERNSGSDCLLAIINLKGSGTHQLSTSSLAVLPEGDLWSPVLSSEDPSFALDPMPVEYSRDRLNICFRRPGALVLEARTAALQGEKQP
jgi:maltooligosyltrehalose trehalohydrolase